MFGRKRNTAPKPVYGNEPRAHGLTAVAVNQIIDAEMEHRRGFTDYPWSQEFRHYLLGKVSGLLDRKAVIEKIREEARIRRGGDGRLVPPNSQQIAKPKKKRRRKPKPQPMKVTDIKNAVSLALQERGHEGVDLDNLGLDWDWVAAMKHNDQVKALRIAIEDWEKLQIPHPGAPKSESGTKGEQIEVTWTPEGADHVFALCDGLCGNLWEFAGQVRADEPRKLVGTFSYEDGRLIALDLTPDDSTSDALNAVVRLMGQIETTDLAGGAVRVSEEEQLPNVNHMVSQCEKACPAGWRFERGAAQSVDVLFIGHFIRGEGVDQENVSIVVGRDDEFAGILTAGLAKIHDVDQGETANADV